MIKRNDKQPPKNPDGSDESVAPEPRPSVPREIGGRSRGLDPTRYGDWEKNGRCIDF
ncbi:MAG: DUF1674 domain-containing protein [Wenzhouxiangella sp.]|nr:MAG: DUF1674 domain-containing protein [Wenzhouxiangella sp.]